MTFNSGGVAFVAALKRRREPSACEILQDGLINTGQKTPSFEKLDNRGEFKVGGDAAAAPRLKAIFS